MKREENSSKLQMLPQCNSLLCRSTTRFKPMFMRACAVAVLVWLFLYAFTDTDIKTTASYLQNAISKLKLAVSIPKIQRKRQLVLLWTTYFGKDDWLPSTKSLQCPVSECDVTSNRTLLSKSSAVVLHWRDTDIHDLPDCFPSNGTRCPLWVLFNKEAPPHTHRHILEAVQNDVHWTATYRRDSDVYAPYGKIEPRKEFNPEKPDFDINKRPVCWLVSNCNTPNKRELFVSDLSDYVEVDIYGKCGDLKCPHKLVKDCYKWLSKRCKFYLSLENSNCKDYVTEKLYYALSSGMVPVVSNNNSNYHILPPRSYINAADFSSPKELAQYLVTVGNNEELYLSYFWWRKNYEVKDFAYMWLCGLCEKLHDGSIQYRSSRKNLASWWFGQSGCTT